VDYLLAAVNRYFEIALTPADILHSFSGVRPLYDDNAANPSAVTRDYVFDIDAPDGAPALLSVFGGKITTYRKLAEHALEKLAPFFPKMGGAWTQTAPLPGGDMPGGDFGQMSADMARRYPWLPTPAIAGYCRRYGTRIEELLRGASSLADLGRHFGAALYEREARFLIAQEWATTADDVLNRRTKHALHLSAAERAGFEVWFADLGMPKS
jgi:glycerol-3-phosphate dehydrogenase